MALEQEERIAENDRQMHQMQRRLREEELRILRGQTKVDESDCDRNESDCDLLRGQTKVDERALDEALMTCPCLACTCSPRRPLSLIRWMSARSTRH